MLGWLTSRFRAAWRLFTSRSFFLATTHSDKASLTGDSPEDDVSEAYMLASGILVGVEHILEKSPFQGEKIFVEVQNKIIDGKLETWEDIESYVLSKKTKQV